MKEKTKAKIVIILIISIIACGFGSLIGTLTSDIVNINLENNKIEKLNVVNENGFEPNTIELVQTPVENENNTTTNNTAIDSITGNISETINDTGNLIWDTIQNWTGM
ncbi:MAG: hypothetical protein K8V75_00270 [Methanobrevibacter woesei]|nr:hypothetical protein [Methanobrevibacter woesei]